MLRVSAQTTETDIDIQGINGDEDGAAKGIEYGPELMRLAEAVAERDQEKLRKARQQLQDQAGTTAVVEAASVAANFQRMVRIADSTGIPVDDLESEVGQQVRAELDLERFPSAQNTLQSG